MTSPLIQNSNVVVNPSHTNQRNYKVTYKIQPGIADQNIAEYLLKENNIL